MTQTQFFVIQIEVTDGKNVSCSGDFSPSKAFCSLEFSDGIIKWKVCPYVSDDESIHFIVLYTPIEDGELVIVLMWLSLLHGNLGQCLILLQNQYYFSTQKLFF